MEGEQNRGEQCESAQREEEHDKAEEREGKLSEDAKSKNEEDEVYELSLIHI